jgi:hypothetical protein
MLKHVVAIQSVAFANSLADRERDRLGRTSDADEQPSAAPSPKESRHVLPIRDLVDRLKEHYLEHPERYRRYGDYLLYGGVVLTLLVAAYILLISS